MLVLLFNFLQLCNALYLYHFNRREVAFEINIYLSIYLDHLRPDALNDATM